MSTGCIDSYESACGGDVYPRAALSGSGLSYDRCDKHYREYCDKLGPVLQNIRRRYPDERPADFDPMYAGERWDEDDSWP
jgi:hypothetical protein